MSDGVAGLLERSLELEAVAKAVARARDGSGGVLLIEGEAGIGKTELLGAGRDLASSQGLTVLVARASELEREYAFGVARQLFQPPLAALDPDARGQALSGAATLAGSLLGFEDDSPAGSEREIFAALHGLHWLCANLAWTQPLMLAVDDAQWSDAASLRFLDYLAGRIQDLPVITLATVRTGDPNSPVDLVTRLRDEHTTQSIRPDSLSLDATVTFLRGRLSEAAEPSFCSACHSATGGNPLLLSELARALALEGIAATDAESSRVAEVGGRGLAERLLGRIAQLAPDALAVARAVAVLEPHATLRRVSEAVEVDHRRASRGAHALVEAGVLRDGSPLGFVHPLLRSAVEEGMSEPQRRDLHAAAARVHDVDGSDAGIAAAHLVRTDTASGPWVSAALRAAAREALSRSAPGPAVSFLRRALDEDAPKDERAAVMHELGSALLRDGDGEGIEWMKRAREASDDPAFRAGIAEELGPSLMIRGRADESVALAQESLAELGKDNKRNELVLRAAIVRTCLGGHEEALGAPYDELKRAASNAAGDTLEERIALQYLALGGALGREKAPDVRGLAMRALDDEGAVRAAAAFGRPLTEAALALGMAGDPAKALRFGEVGLEEMRRRASVFGLSSNLVTQATLRLSTGDLAGAASDAGEAYELATAYPMVRVAATGVQIAIALERGEVAEAARLVSERGLAGDLATPLFVGMARTARGRLFLVQGRAAEALADFESAAAAFEGVGTFGPDLLPPRLHVALAQFALGRVEDATAKVRREEDWARGIENERLVGEALRVRGLIDADAGVEALRAAVGTIAPTEFRLDHARALVDLGAALRRANERRTAREPLREGMGLAQGCGAIALEQRARVELEATGARPRSVVTSGAESLTPSELRVAQLAAEEMTNREIAQALFVTPKTVETHLRHCYQKLEITGRAELRPALSANAQSG